MLFAKTFRQMHFSFCFEIILKGTGWICTIVEIVRCNLLFCRCFEKAFTFVQSHFSWIFSEIIIHRRPKRFYSHLGLEDRQNEHVVSMIHGWRLQLGDRCQTKYFICNICVWRELFLTTCIRCDLTSAFLTLSLFFTEVTQATVVPHLVFTYIQKNGIKNVWLWNLDI